MVYTLKNLRKNKFPGHGGAKKCAAAFGVSQSQWSNWEAGTRTPDIENLEKLAAFFDVTVDEIRTEQQKAPDFKPGAPIGNELVQAIKNAGGIRNILDSAQEAALEGRLDASEFLKVSHSLLSALEPTLTFLRSIEQMTDDKESSGA